MTVEIAITNGKEAVVVADSRVSTDRNYRQSDSVNKIGDVKGEKFDGIITGAGDGNLVWRIISSTSAKQKPSLDDLLTDIQQDIIAFASAYEERMLTVVTKDIEIRTMLIPEDQRQNYKSTEMQRMLTELSQRRANSDVHNTGILVVAYDNDSQRIRMHSVSYYNHLELYTHHVENGSGKDAAGLYLMAKLQGVDAKKLPVDDLLFFAVNAYTQATMNQGVGGTPKMCIITKEGTRMLPRETTVALVNLSGAYFAEADGISQEAARAYTAGLYNLGKREDTQETIAQALQMTPEALTSLGSVII
ncbi:hypothetical protein HZB02_05175 [Candidatus Woesearchaeota archaeon]|nr:hypothetical protein [Candidatus Woesearchaeota archaeon]